MMEKIKRNMKPTLVLGAICIIVAVLLALVNMLTEPVIEEARAAEITASLTEVMPNGKFNTEPDKLGGDAPETVKAVYTDQNGGGYVVILETQTSYTTGAAMGITVAISTDGKIVGAKVTSYSESKDFGKETYPESYVGLDADGVANAPTVSGVTYSSAAFKSAIYDAMKYLGVASGEIAPPSTEEKPEVTPLRSDEELEAEALLLSGGSSIENAEMYGRPYNMPRLYAIDGGDSYVAYVVTLGWGNYPVSEGIVHIDKNGDIKNVKVLTWVPGGGSPNYDVPPFDKDIINTYLGKDYWNIEDASLVTGATGTSTDFKNAVADAVRYISINKLERTDEKVLELAKDFLPHATGFEKASTEGAPETLKRLYKVGGAKGGYLAHIVVDGEYTPIATEALVYIDVRGKIEDVELLVWNVGHGVEAGDFAEGFIGKSAGNIESVELVSAATGTSGDFRGAIAELLDFVPANNAPTVLAIVLIFVLFAGGIAALIYFKRRNRAK